MATNPKLDIQHRASYLINEAERLSNIINTTIDEAEFITSYDKIITIFRELCSYEKYHIFKGQSPRQNLKEIQHKRDKATSNFYERKRKYLYANTSKRNYTDDQIQEIYFSTNIYDIDAAFTCAGELATDKGYISLFMIITLCKEPLPIAKKLLKQLEAFHVIEKNSLFSKRKALMTPGDFSKLVYLISDSEVAWGPRKKHTNQHLVIDNMEGHDFEHFCADLLRKNDFVNVEVTQGSGDHGIDILAEKDDITYAIQCKCYSSNIGNAAVQQAHTGKALYHKDVAVVMTNRYFTSQAKDEAAQLGVKLWDRDKLNFFVGEANKKYK